MNDPFHCFSTKETFTLIFGNERVHLYVARPIFDQIPFFKNVLKGDGFREAHTKQFGLPEDDLEAIANLLYFVYAVYVKPIPFEHDQPVTDTQRDTVKLYIRTCIVADKYLAKRTADQILDALVTYHVSRVTNPSPISIYREAGWLGSVTYRFLVNTGLARIQNEVEEGESSTSDSLDQILTDGPESFCGLSKEELMDISTALMRFKGK